LDRVVRYTLVAECPVTGARAGRLETPHGAIDTPAFMPVGTAASVKAVAPRTLRDEVRAGMILANTYHLYLRPGRDVLRAAGGLHRFMGWDGPILTDSGGFQVFSLADLRTLDDDGVTFRSHLDGSPHTFTPENVVDAQRDFGSDVMMVLDECPPGTVDEQEARRANERTIRWANRAFDRYRATEPVHGHRQTLFPIVQGATYPDLRRAGARALLELDADGYAIGGLSVGEEAAAMYATVEVTTAELPRDRPRYLMGVGTPADLIECVSRGVDMFDCVMPTRNARNGTLFTTEGRLNIRAAKWRLAFEPLDPGLEHHHAGFSKAYLRHLTMSDEPLFMEIASVQNLAFYTALMAGARQAIVEGTFPAWRDDWLSRATSRL
jgi:queuine tRNA-ribosyltransferase